MSNKTKERIRKVFTVEKFFNSYTILILFSILLTFIIELISRGSFALAKNFVLNSSITFLYNVFLVMITLSIVLLFKRRIFGYFIISTIWLGLSTANNILKNLRGTPLAGSDLKLIKSGLSIIDSYFSKKQIILLGFGIFLLVALIIGVFIFAPKSKKKNNYAASFITILVLLISSKYVTNSALNHKIISNNFWDLISAYDMYGFSYAFNNTLLHTGISKPAHYSEKTVDNIVTSIESEESVTTLSSSDTSINSEIVSKPNIIMVQLESFFDPTLINGVEFNTNPIPNFRKLSNEYSSGAFSVSTVGGGTANTEFEAITGMSLDFFGPGEYPYNTILKSSTSESINYALKEDGYTTHAIHNHEATFYGRDKVFANLGFDTFTPVEYMIVPERTPVGWAKDYALVDSITDCLKSTEGQDFIYTISVQGHGTYPSDVKLENKHVSLTECPDYINKNSLEYYANQIYEMDEFIAQLIDTVSQIAEDTVIVFYGDHLPGLGLSADSLVTGDLYSTEYFIWNNMNLEKRDEDLEAYQMTSRILYDLNMNNGLLTKLHQEYLYPSADEPLSKDDYDYKLNTIEYDMLYGKGYSYETGTKHEPTNMTIGIKTISVSNIYEKDGKIYAEGENFTTNTILLVNNVYIPTSFIDSSKIYCDSPELNPADNKVKVIQFTTNLKVLRASPEFILGQPASGILQ